MGWTDHDDPCPMPDLPEAPRDPSIDSALEEPAERETRSRDVTLNLYLSRIEQLKAALRYFLQAGDATDRMRARSLGTDLLRRMDEDDARRMRR